MFSYTVICDNICYNTLRLLLFSVFLFHCKQENQSNDILLYLLLDRKWSGALKLLRLLSINPAKSFR